MRVGPIQGFTGPVQSKGTPVRSVGVTRDTVKMVWDFLQAYGLIVLGSWSILAAIAVYDRWRYGDGNQVHAAKPRTSPPPPTDDGPRLRAQSRR